MANIRTKDIMKSLSLVASVLGDKYGVNVIVGGDQACTDGKNIYLPRLPLDTDSTLLSLAKGFVDHEAAHIRYTDFAALKAANLTPFEKHIWNIIEDWRVENQLTRIFPGCGPHFRWLIEYHFGEDAETAEAGNDPASAVLSWLLLSVRAWDVLAIGTQRDKEAKKVNAVYPKLLSQLDAVLCIVHNHCPDTQTAIEHAKDMAAIIKQYAVNSPEAENGAEGTETPSPSQSQQQNASKQPHRQGQQHQRLQQLCDASTDELPKHFGDLLAQSLNAQQSQKSHTAISVATVGHRTARPLSPQDKERIARTSVALRTRLHGLLQAYVQASCISGRRGKLDTQRLHALAVHNPRIFRSQGESRAVSTAVHLLLDCSSSMQGPRMTLASQACYAVASALQRCKGVNMGVTAFPSVATTPSPTVSPLVLHGEKVHDKFQLTAQGGTPLAEALWWVLQRMCPLREQRKIICILSDGMPDFVEATVHALAQAKALSFEVMGLGIQDSCMKLLLPETSRTVYTLEDVAPAMFGMLQQSLLSNPST